MSNNRIQITPEIAENMRQFEVVCKIAVQVGAARIGSSVNRISTIHIGINEFGLSRNQASICLARAQVMLSDVSNSMSSETLLIAERRRRLKVLQPAA